MDSIVLALGHGPASCIVPESSMGARLDVSSLLTLSTLPDAAASPRPAASSQLGMRPLCCCRRRPGGRKLHQHGQIDGAVDVEWRAGMPRTSTPSPRSLCVLFFSPLVPAAVALIRGAQRGGAPQRRERTELRARVVGWSALSTPPASERPSPSAPPEKGRGSRAEWGR